MATEKNIYELLQADHRRVARLLDALAASVDPPERGQLFSEIRTVLEAHTDGEAITLYEVLSGFDSLAEPIEQAHREHLAVAELLAELEEIAEDSRDFVAKAAELRDCVERHVHLEEELIFPEAQEVLADDEAIELAGRFAAHRAAYSS